MINTDVKDRKTGKGQTYSLLAVLITVPILLFIIFYMSFTQTLKFGSNEKVVSDQLYVVARSIEDDVGRAADIVSRRGLIAIVDDIIKNGGYLWDGSPKFEYKMITGNERPKQAMERFIEDGNIECEDVQQGSDCTCDNPPDLDADPPDCTNPSPPPANQYIYYEPTLMVNNNIGHWIEEIQKQNYGFITDVMISGDVEVKLNADPFKLSVTFPIDLLVEDRQGIAKISKADVYKTYNVSIEGIEDPMFPIHTGNKLKRIIWRSPYGWVAKKVSGDSSQEGGGECTGYITFDSQYNLGSDSNYPDTNPDGTTDNNIYPGVPNDQRPPKNEVILINNGWKVGQIGDGIDTSKFRGLISYVPSGNVPESLNPNEDCYFVLDSTTATSYEEVIETMTDAIDESNYNKIFICGGESYYEKIGGNWVPIPSPDGDRCLSGTGIWSLPIEKILEKEYYFDTGLLENPGGGLTIFDMLEGELNPIPAPDRGIETFINVDTVAGKFQIEKGRSLIAHKYFQASTYDGCWVRGTPDWFRIDTQSAQNYGIFDLRTACNPLDEKGKFW